MRIGSLFSGIGGLELGLERSGLGKVVWQVEIDPFCRAVLAKHWPDAERHEDVCSVGGHCLAPVDVVCGGFPCQDVSVAGKGAGLAGARSGLWREFRRIVEEIRPRIVIVENVASGKSRWLPAVRSQLCDLGYGSVALGLGADDLGAPHRRRRVFVVAMGDASGAIRFGRSAGDAAYSDTVGVALGDPNREGQPQQGRGVSALRGRPCDADEQALPDGDGDGDGVRLEPRRLSRPHGPSPLQSGQDVRPAQSGVGGDADGLSGRMDGHAWPMGRGEAQAIWEPSRTQAKVANRPARLKALGNAVVPQCAEAVGRWILEMMR